MKCWIIINFWFTLANCTKRPKIITTTAKKNKTDLNYIANIGIYRFRKNRQKLLAEWLLVIETSLMDFRKLRSHHTDCYYYYYFMNYQFSGGSCL